ncbi:MAG: hypothetical protein ACKV2T_36220 [Kofleriaceae bacterium]
MIPYEELVIALQTWRAKQGLPVAQMSGQLVPPPMPAPRPAQPFLGTVATPPPLSPAAETYDETRDSVLDVDGALIEEAHYESEGDDFAMAFGAAGAVAGDGDGEDSTSIGSAPGPAPADDGGTEVASPGARRGGNRGEDW